MAERGDFNAVNDVAALRAEITRQGKVIRALIDRSERSAGHGERSDFAVFHSTVAFEQQLQRRTDDLRRALRENERITRSLRESESLLRTVVQQPLVGIAILDQGRFSFANAKFGDMFGYGVDVLPDIDPFALVVAEDRALVREQVRRRVAHETLSVNYTFRGLRQDGSVIDVETSGTVIEFRGRRALLSVFLDVTERLRAERDRAAFYARLEDQSNRDALTGLFNRRYFDAALERGIAAARVAKQPLALALCDLDHFKRVNDGFGHEAGDRVLGAFARELTQAGRPDDVACRIGGEEFALILPYVGAQTAFGEIEALRRAVACVRIPEGGVAIGFTFSCGIAAFPADGATASELFRRADKALYAAKHGGRDRSTLVSPRAEDARMAR